jgi:hypothetical protein
LQLIAGLANFRSLAAAVTFTLIMHVWQQKADSTGRYTTFWEQWKLSLGGSDALPASFAQDCNWFWQ